MPGAQWTRVTEEVATALAGHRPVVALETTLVSHGFSAGRGLAVAVESERRVRAAGAAPATVGIVDGAIHVGLTKAELERFAEAGTSARKVGARDLAACLAQGALGATTVGGTLAVCRQIGIRFMGTGGIGGVHRGFAESLDISGDLLQIARTPRGGGRVRAPSRCWTWARPPNCWRRSPSRCSAGSTATLPRFYTAEGGPPGVRRGQRFPGGGADLHRRTGSSTGRGACCWPGRRPTASTSTPLIDEAVARVRGQNLAGQAVTPAVLSLVHELSGGRSVEVNRQLIADNAALAAETAVAYTQLKNA